MFQTANPYMVSSIILVVVDFAPSLSRWAFSFSSFCRHRHRLLRVVDPVPDFASEARQVGVEVELWRRP